MASYKVVGKNQDGKYFDGNAYHDVIGYCLQPDKAVHGYVGSRALNLCNAANEMETVARVYHNDKQVRLRHSVISFDEGDHITAAQAAEIAEQAVRYFGDQYQILYSVHEDAAHIHAHIVMNQVSYQNGLKYKGTKKQHYDFVNYMKHVVAPYGIPFIPVSDD